MSITILALLKIKKSPRYFGQYVYTLALTDNTKIESSPAHEPPDNVSVKGARNASNSSISQDSEVIKKKHFKSNKKADCDCNRLFLWGE